MELSKLNVQKFSIQEMTKLDGGQYFKPTIDGVIWGDERRWHLKKGIDGTQKQYSFLDRVCNFLFG
ncbi:MAG: hypothetical protein E6Q66_00690 [Pedobacter sp.]|nr:MAG: hypothetical protein E6Q66_00690 [Pedobacter sp.]